MKRKTIILAVVAAAAMAITLVGCGVKITNIAVPESAMVEKGESITLPVVYGTDDAPAVTPETAATGESAETDEKVAKAAEFAYTKGAMGLMDLLDARRTLRQVQIEAATACAEYAKALSAWRLQAEYGSKP